MPALAASGWTGCTVGFLLWSAQVRALQAGRAARAEQVVRAAHEVRGPLTAALLALHSLAAKGVGADALRAVEGELRRAARCLEDLQASPAGTWVPDTSESVDLIGLVRAHAETLDALCGEPGRQVRFASDLDCAWVRADPARLAQVVANLVRNGLEHGAGEVRVLVRHSGSGFALEVLDDGEGLPAPLEDLVAVPLPDVEERPGRGRGLAIACELASRAGGRLRTAPAARGTRFVLELPADRLSLPTAPAL